MKKVIAIFAVMLATSGLAQAQNTSLLGDHPDARNDRMPSSHSVENPNPRAHKKPQHHVKAHHQRHHRKHH